MPEGPEIRLLKEKFNDKISEKKIFSIELLGKNKNDNIIEPSPIIVMGCKGKLLFIQTNDYYLHLRMGLTGFLFDKCEMNKINVDDKNNATYNTSMIDLQNVKYKLNFGENYSLFLNDTKKLSSINILKNTMDHEKELEKMGADILSKEFTFEYLEGKIKSKKIGLTYFLMDQKYLSGVGNYIKNESLYISKIHPKRKTNELNYLEIKNLYDAIKLVSFSVLLTHLEREEIEIPNEIKSIIPKNVEVPYNYHVYKQTKDQEGNDVIFEKIGGRNTYYAPYTQIK